MRRRDKEVIEIGEVRFIGIRDRPTASVEREPAARLRT